MKKRILALLLAVCIACSMVVLPASADSSNAAVQTAVMLGAISSEEAANPMAALTRGQLARLLTAFSAYRTSVSTQSTSGTLFSDVSSTSSYAPYVRIAVQRGWMSGYTDGSFRPDKAITIDEAVTAVLSLLSYDVTSLGGTFPTAQLTKAEQIGLLSGINRRQGEGVTLADGAVLLYNALTCNTNDSQVYASTLGFTVTDGKVDTSSVLMSNVNGPYIATAGAQLPFTPAVVYLNGEASAYSELSAYDVYYYNEEARTVWVYNKHAAGRITAVSPSASAPTSVTVAGTEYTISTSAAAYQISALSGGGVGQVVTLLLGMNDGVVSVLTGSQANEVFYGVVQSSTRSLTETNGADVMQTVAVACTDGVTRTVNVDKGLNFKTSTVVQVTVNKDGESLQELGEISVGGILDAENYTLGNYKLADNVQILDTTSEGLAGTIRPGRLSGTDLNDLSVRYYTTNANGEIDRLILNNVTGDLYEYAALDTVRNLSTTIGDKIDEKVDEKINDAPGITTQSTSKKTDTSNLALKNLIVPSTSDIIYSIIDGSINNTLWDNLSNNTGSLASYAMQRVAEQTSGPISDILSYLSEGATYVCYVKGEQVTYNTSVKYPVVAGGVAVSKSPAGNVKLMVQLMPAVIDRIGAAEVLSGSTRYETADDMQVYLWYGGQYFATSLSQINDTDYNLIGWYDNMGCAAGQKIRILVAIKKD